MSSSFDVNLIHAAFEAGTVAVGTSLRWVGKAPSNATGGCITIMGGNVVTTVTNAAGSAPQFRVLKYSAAGAVSGTIVATQVPGTGALTANSPGTMTITNGFVDAGEYVVVERGGTAVSATSAAQDVILTYVMGY